jgi:hypothetical protein
MCATLPQKPSNAKTQLARYTVACQEWEKSSTSIPPKHGFRPVEAVFCPILGRIEVQKFDGLFSDTWDPIHLRMIACLLS